MYWRSFSNPVSGDGVAVGDAAGVGLVLDVVGALPPHAPKSKTTNTSNTRPDSFIVRFSERIFHQLLIPDVHDRTLSILVNNIEPATHPRMLKKIVMLVV